MAPTWITNLGLFEAVLNEANTDTPSYRTRICAIVPSPPGWVADFIQSGSRELAL